MGHFTFLYLHGALGVGDLVPCEIAVGFHAFAQEYLCRGGDAYGFFGKELLDALIPDQFVSIEFLAAAAHNMHAVPNQHIALSLVIAA